MKSLIAAYRNVDTRGKAILGSVLLVLFVRMVWLDVQHIFEFRQVVHEQEQILVELNRITTAPNHVDLEYPTIPASATKEERTAMLGVYRKIGLDAVAQREQVISDLRKQLSAK
jgi:adenylate cyclase class IV